jgi:hypothetical protein
VARHIHRQDVVDHQHLLVAARHIRRQDVADRQHQRDVAPHKLGEDCCPVDWNLVRRRDEGDDLHKGAAHPDEANQNGANQNGESQNEGYLIYKVGDRYHQKVGGGDEGVV